MTQDPTVPNRTPKQRSWLAKVMIFVVAPLLQIFVTVSLIVYYLYGGQAILSSVKDWNPFLLLQKADVVVSDTINFVELDPLFIEIPGNRKQVLVVTIKLEVGRLSLADNLPLPNCSPPPEPNSIAIAVTNLNDCKDALKEAISKTMISFRKDDFSGGVGTIRVREALTTIIADVIYPIKLRALLVVDLAFSG